MCQKYYFNYFSYKYILLTYAASNTLVKDWLRIIHFLKVSFFIIYWILFTGPGSSYLEDPKWREGSFPFSERDPCKGEEGGGWKFAKSKSVPFLPATRRWKWLPKPILAPSDPLAAGWTCKAPNSNISSEKKFTISTL